MINLAPAIAQIELLLAQNTDASLTYAALECRLAIEGICYERLRIAHDYISHDDLKRWQPRDVVNTLIQEVDSGIAKTFTLSISKEPLQDSSTPPTKEEYQAIEFLPVGKQIGFDPNKFGKLWNALAKVALHITIPVSKDHDVNRYGNKDKIRAKVVEALEEIKRIGEGTLLSTGVGEEVSFECVCGAKNKRRLELLKDLQEISCIRPECSESFTFTKGDKAFNRRVFDVSCKKCGKHREIPIRTLEKLRVDQSINFGCGGCGAKIIICWRPAQLQ
ncbi:MAG: hypothetical protein Q7J44_22650 [Pseudotabrizicola sp.]|uniref:hypothetical protein n=1 Tax=Pseudotabrizicola sp. TaxID=2939647 RepID=UPI00271BFB5C|nr:hypothetical protein [Pseudotabrizicola sp.]MDO9641336.1 hypothetical protein [Pseudotabrizicola sp.]